MVEEYAKEPRESRIDRLTCTADELAAAVKGQSEPTRSRRPDTKNWAAKEVVCHLRDAEESFNRRFAQILAMDADPTLTGPGADRIAEDRQYLRNDTAEAIGAFRKWREETVELFGKLTPAQWDKGAILPVRGRITMDGFLALMAWHDDNHLDQIKRALNGQA